MREESGEGAVLVGEEIADRAAIEVKACTEKNDVIAFVDYFGSETAPLLMHLALGDVFRRVRCGTTRKGNRDEEREENGD